MSNENPIVVLQRDILELREQWDQVAVDKTTFAREAEFAMQLLSGNDYLRRTALNDRGSLMASVINAGAIGVSLNPAQRQAYLVPRDGKVRLEISYMGLIDLAMQTGGIRWAQSQVVYEKDRFELRGYDQPPVHEYNPFGKGRGNIVGAYVVVKTRDGDYLTHAMDIETIYESARNRSSAWKAYLKDNSKTNPWLTDEVEMVRKTVVKQATKYWRAGPRFDQAVQYLNTDGGEGLEVLNKEPDKEPIPQALEQAARAAAAQGVSKYQTYFAGVSKADRRALAPIHEELKAAALAADAARTVDAGAGDAAGK
jgi:recombination protein RecT